MGVRCLCQGAIPAGQRGLWEKGVTCLTGVTAAEGVTWWEDRAKVPEASVSAQYRDRLQRQLIWGRSKWEAEGSPR